MAQDQEAWDHRVILEKAKGNSLYWRVAGDKIVFQIESSGNGWVGFGLSPDGQLRNSDIVISRVGRKQTSFLDYHVEKCCKIVIDKHQDWKLLSTSRNKTHSIIVFSRKLDTCDSEDLAIMTGTQRVIYSFPESSRTFNSSTNFNSMTWKSESLILLQPKVTEVQQPEDISKWDLVADKFSIPQDREDFILCRIVRGPPLKRKHHVVKVAPLIRTQNPITIYDMLAYRCFPRSQEEAEVAVRRGHVECNTGNIPSLFSRCNTLFAIWGLNSGSLVYPQHIGSPLGGEVEYFMLVVYYLNPMHIRGVKDNSGFRVYYTPNLRPFDASMMRIGLKSQQNTVIVPPKQKEFLIAAHSSEQCFSKVFPKQGINISAALIHTHFGGVKVQLRHFRGVKELPPIVYDMNYDPNYQVFQYFSKDIQVLQEDQMTVECTFDTSRRKVPMHGGVRYPDVSCVAFLLYHSPVPLARSLSYTPKELIAKLVGLDLTSRKHKFATDDAKLKNYLDNYDWSRSNTCTLENAMRFSPHNAECLTSFETYLEVPDVTYPDLRKRYRAPDPCMIHGKYTQQGEPNGPRCSSY